MSRKSWLKAVVKEERHLLSARLRSNRLDLANGHKDQAVEGRKEAIFLDETKATRLGSDGRKWAHKLPGEGLTSRLAQGMLKFRGGLLMVWGACLGMALDMHARLMGGWMVTFATRFWRKSSCSALDICAKPLHR